MWGSSGSAVEGVQGQSPIAVVPLMNVLLPTALMMAIMCYQCGSIDECSTTNGINDGHHVLSVDVSTDSTYRSTFNLSTNAPTM